MTKIFLLTSHDNNSLIEANKGAAALVITAIESLRKFIPDAKFVTSGQFSKEFSSQQKLKVIKGGFFYKTLSLSESLKSLLLLFRCLIWVTLNKYLGISVNWLVNHEQLKEMRQADIIIAFIQDTYSDNNRVFSVIDHTIEILTASLLNKRVMIWNSSIGPLRHWLTSRLGRFIFNRVNSIVLREKISLMHLQEAGVNNPQIYTFPDTAFLLEPASKERTDKILLEEGISNGSRPLIGIGVNKETPLGQRVYRTRCRNIVRGAYLFFDYCLPDNLSQQLANLVRKVRSHSSQAEANRIKRKPLAEVIDYLVDQFNVTVILISHVIVPKGRERKDMRDDRLEAQAVFEMVQRKNRVKLLTGEYTTQEIKGIIGQCDLFIGMRMHSCIAAISQAVPTLALAYNYKFLGIMELVGQRKWVCTKILVKELLPKIQEIWRQRDKIQKQLYSQMPKVKESALGHARLAVELLSRS